LLRDALPRADSFVGHVGGDDFVVLSRDPAWEDALHALLARFADAVAQFFDADTLAQGGYWSENRRGDAMFFPVPTLSVGACAINPGSFDSHREVANVLAELKKAAKRSAGNKLFVDRRQR
jgi:GGDEF domain-containing protein